MCHKLIFLFLNPTKYPNLLTRVHITNPNIRYFWWVRYIREISPFKTRPAHILHPHACFFNISLLKNKNYYLLTCVHITHPNVRYFWWVRYIREISPFKTRPAHTLHPHACFFNIPLLKTFLFSWGRSLGAGGGLFLPHQQLLGFCKWWEKQNCLIFCLFNIGPSCLTARFMVEQSGANHNWFEAVKWGHETGHLENNTWFSSVLPCMYWRKIHRLYHILSRVC